MSFFLWFLWLLAGARVAFGFAVGSPERQQIFSNWWNREPR